MRQKLLYDFCLERFSSNFAFKAVTFRVNVTFCATMLTICCVTAKSESKEEYYFPHLTVLLTGSVSYLFLSLSLIKSDLVKSLQLANMRFSRFCEVELSKSKNVNSCSNKKYYEFNE